MSTYKPTSNCSAKRVQLPAVKTLSKAILAITLSGMGVAHASDYSSVTFFGDSLTDGGYFKPVLDKEESGQFTTNPDNTWATPFAESLGLTSTANTIDGSRTGNNYAIGGARAGKDVQREGLPVASTKTQLDNYLENNTVDSNGLYSVWIGANDLLAVVKDLPSKDTIISEAVQDQVAVINKLHTNGAKYILAPNIPDVGLTPYLAAAGQSLQAFGTGMSAQYNDALYEGVKSTGANVIPLDTFSLLQKVAKNPSAYGFSNMNETACGSVSSLECGRDDIKEGAENSYFFADSIHPTGRAHRMIADYANAVVTAPGQVSVLPHIATQSGLATNERLQTHINQRQNQNHSTQSMSPEGWISVNINALDVAGFESSGNAQLLMGLDFTHSSLPNAMTGVYANLSRSELDSSKRSGLDKVDFDELGLGLYHSRNLGKVQLNGALGYSTIDMELNRKVSLDNYTENYNSDVDGSRYYASLQAGYPMALNDLTQFANTTITPYLGATANRVKLDAIKEGTSNDPLAMQFDKQKYNTIYGTLGVKASSQLSNTLNVFGDVHYQKQLDDNHKEVTARVNTLSDMSFTAPKASLDDDSFGASLGLSRQFKSFLGNAGVSYASGDKDELTSVFIELIK
ncbi:autotransporter domain-containing protein [Psychrobacter piechaudii]|uniref:Esterase EstA n=1 Tax=Psychrobacter piechaudii TaxID=1945521 RepID=A0A1R4GRG6_9GAMM|nr:autotransporter domain-containing protein [Psychrobacter piechaudii]SJM70798.1 Esterase EstA precursor [Psychrobacter piechaudii]